MRTMTLGLLAAGAALLAVPANAEDYYVGGPGVGVEFGDHHHYRDWDRDRDVRVYRGTEGFDRWRGEGCRITVVRHADGSVTRVRRCRD